MKKASKIITLSTAAFACCIAGVSMMNITAQAATEEYVQTVGTQTVATQGFYMENGASVRMKETSAGIKFSTSVTPSFIEYLNTTYEDATIEWHTLITGVNMCDGDIEKVTPDLKKPDGTPNAGDPACKDFTLTPKAVSASEMEYAAAIVYEGSTFAELTDAQKLMTYNADLIARSYVSIDTGSDEPTIIYAQATDTIRNMKAVAYAIIQRGTYASEPTKEALLYPYTGISKEEFASKVFTSETHGGYCSEVDSLYEITVDEGLLKNDVEYKAYIGAKPLTYTKANNVFTITNDGLKTAKKGETSLTLFGNDGTIINQPFTNATLAIDEASDLAYFNMKSTSKTLDGYYVLTKNIEYNNAHFEQVVKSWTNMETNGELADKTKGGLSGTFDGNGYAIDGLKISGAGLFKYIRGGTVKNVAFTNTQVYHYSAVNTLLAAGVSTEGATIENVYAHIKTMSTSELNSVFGRVQNAETLKMQNVVVEYGSVTADTGSDHGSLFIYTPVGTPTQVQNVYVVGPDVLNVNGGDAGNRGGTKWTGVKRYNSVADWKANVAYGEVAATDNNYDTFDTTFWTEVDGIVSWKSKLNPGEKASVEYANTLTNFSAMDGDTVMAQYSLADVINGETVVSVKDASGNALTYENGKVMGLTTSGTQATETYITVETTSKIIKVNLVAYTLVIDEVSDFNYFKLTAADKTGSYYTKNFNGYYLMAKNVDFNSQTFAQLGDNSSDWAALNKSVGLTGTFDGNGYTIANLKIQGYGLFYNVYGGTIKNVAFTNAQLYNYYSYNSLFADTFTKGRVENVYIETGSYGSSRSLFADYMEFTNVKMQNVVIYSKATGSNALESLSRSYDSANIGKAFTDVYVINTKTVRSTYDGVNRRTDSYGLTGVKRYDTLADWKANVAYGEVAATDNNYDTFDTTYWTEADGIVSWKAKADPVI